MNAKPDPPISDTWLGTYRPIIYTPQHRLGKVLDVCDELGVDVVDVSTNGAPKHYVILITDAVGVEARKQLTNRLRFYSQKYLQRWANLLFHPALLETPAPRRWVTNVIPLPTVWRGVQVVTVGERAGIGNHWLRDLRRARNLIYEATRGTSVPLHPKSPLSVRLDIAEGRGLLAAAVEGLPEYAAELAVAIGETSAALVVTEPASVEFLTHKAGYRVEKIYQQLLTAERSMAA